MTLVVKWSGLGLGQTVCNKDGDMVHTVERGHGLCSGDLRLLILCANSSHQYAERRECRYFTLCNLSPQTPPLTAASSQRAVNSAAGSCHVARPERRVNSVTDRAVSEVSCTHTAVTVPLKQNCQRV